MVTLMDYHFYGEDDYFDNVTFEKGTEILGVRRPPNNKNFGLFPFNCVRPIILLNDYILMNAQILNSQ